MLKKTGVRFASLAAATGLTTSVLAQWTVSSLHPAGADFSQAFGISGGQQIGFANFGGNSHAGLWSGTAASWVDLHPDTTFTASFGQSTSGAHQVGYVGSHAALWSGTAASWIDLHPAAQVRTSIALGISGTQQVGYFLDAAYVACLWSGTAASCVPLGDNRHDCAAYGTSGTQQVGWAKVGSVYHASLWSGSAASWVDLNPAGSTFSRAFAVAGTQQCGSATIGGNPHPGLWYGTAASWVDLNPLGTGGEIHATSGTQQVGYVYVTVSGKYHASLWSGTAASWVDLSQYLTGSWGDSYAEGIWSDGTSIYVAGWGYNNTARRFEALLWTSASCRADFNNDGFVNGDDYDVFASLFESGDIVADFNNDGFVNGDDYDAFASAFEAGC